MIKKSIAYVALLASLGACSLSNEAYHTPGQPEALLEHSSEQVSLPLTAESSVVDVSDWLNKDQPSRAVLSCSDATMRCTHVAQVLDSFGVPYEYAEQAGGMPSVTLLYDRVVARNCDHSFRSNHHNSRNLNHPALGCSIAANILQMVSDHRQIVNPSLSGLQDAERAAADVHAYKNPK